MSWCNEFPRVELLAYAFVLAWGNLLFGSNVLSSAITQSIGFSSVYFLSTAALAFTYFLLCFLIKEVCKIDRWVFSMIAAAMMTLPSFYLTFANAETPYLFEGGVIASVLTGIGSAIMYFECSLSYASTPPRMSALFVVLSLILSSFLYFLSVGSPYPISRIIICLLPIFAMIFLPLPGQPDLNIQDLIGLNNPTSDKGLYLPKYSGRLIVTLLILFIVPNVIASGLQNGDAQDSMLFEYVSIGHLITLAVSLLLLLYIVNKRKNFSYQPLFYPIIFAMVLLLSLASILGLMSSVTVYFSTVIRSLSTIVIWCMITSLVYRLRSKASLRLLLVCLGCEAIGGVVAGWLGLVIDNFGLDNVEKLVFYLVLIVMLVAVLVLILPARITDSLFTLEGQSMSITDSKQTTAPWKDRCLLYAAKRGLTPREQEIFLYIAKSKSNEEIAQELTISALTVKTHRQNIYTKLNVHSVKEIIHEIENTKVV